MAWPYVTKAWFPCADVPLNLYDAHVLSRCVAGDPFYLNYYYINTRPVPRILFQVYAACALPLIGPVFTVKLFLLVYFISLPLAVFLLARANGQSGLLAGLLSVPLTANMCLNSGFCDFCAGLPISILAIAYWMRNKDRLTTGRTFLFAVLLVLVFFGHLFCIAATLFAIIILSVSVGLTRRATKQTVLAGIPCLILLLWYFGAASAQPAKSDLTARSLFQFDAMKWVVKDLVYGRTLAVLGGSTIKIAKVYMLMLLAAALCASVSTRHIALSRSRIQLSLSLRDASMLPFIAFLLLYFVLPKHWGPGGWINQRALVYVLLFACIWVDSLVFPRIRLALCIAISALVIPYAIAVTQIGETINLAAADFTRGIPYVRNHATVAPFTTDEVFPGVGLSGLGHAVGLYALQRDGIYQGDVAAPLGYGGVRFRAMDAMVPEAQLWAGAPTLDLKRYASAIDYTVSWTDSAVGEPLGFREKYTEVFEMKKLKVFERTDGTFAPPRERR
jgi:hypothetical protein